MQFVHNQQFPGYPPHAQPMPADMQQQQQQQQQQQPPQAPAGTLQGQLPLGMPPMSMPPFMNGQPTHMQPGMEYELVSKPKRKQVKNACVNCQKACKKCDDGRPCQRCIKYGLTDTCQDSVRKERKKGVKRGPYKRRNQGSGSSQPSSASSSPAIATPMHGMYASPNMNMRGNMPLSYPGFNGAHYSPFGAVSYPATSHPMMAPSYMMPNMQPNMQQQQMLSANSAMLQYQAAMSVPPPVYNTTPPAAEANKEQEKPASAPANNGTVATDSVNSKPAAEEDGSKLNILSQLCSDVLDRSDAPKADNGSQAPISSQPSYGLPVTSSVGSGSPGSFKMTTQQPSMWSLPSLGANKESPTHGQHPPSTQPQQQQQQSEQVWNNAVGHW
ncbi:uncharacterized protein BYT42DRAFT_578922 [Radiomyces spectabilis]|uniref:uncharacterized protein n=1 Tax=Radiomyces spectabilis TaxID=64574 RepID=UPI00221F9E01|nr:uncharacterized protein BYT42DRAFT_578922 [Radiomyces spectabilis]KAI8373013.1 hypothetical protein BYT42DRAFT_578922 [Radiomyces spectabilis]